MFYLFLLFQCVRRHVTLRGYAWLYVYLHINCVIVNRSLVWTSQALYWQKDLINLLIDMVIRLFRRTVSYTTVMFS